MLYTHGNRLGKLIHCRFGHVVGQNIGKLSFKENQMRRAHQFYDSLVMHHRTGRRPLTLETLTMLPLELIKWGTANMVNWYMDLQPKKTVLS